MKIVADQNILLVNELFGDIGEVVCIPGREMQAAEVKDADVLLVRSITAVNECLLAGSRVKFVGSCTIGVDHLDTQYLEENDITWANAPGCNANAVVQYVLSAMAAAKPEWRSLKIGIVGCGNIGGRLYNILKNLQVDVVAYDPFLSRDSGRELLDLDDVLQCDIITCHTPLTKTGPYPTYHMLNAEQLARLPAHSLLINSGRGAVIDNDALLAELHRCPRSVVLDVWENEPMINQQLLDKVVLGSPHIAGYSVEGKEQGSFMVYQALCQYLKKAPAAEKYALLSRDKMTVEMNGSEDLNQLLLTCYDIRKDDQLLRQQTKDFDNLRKNYLSRREYTHFELPEEAKGSALDNAFTIIKGAEHNDA